MKATIKSIQLQNFKGCKDDAYTFDGENATVCGCNGIGKTTIATAYYWVFADKDTELKSNPSVRCIGEEESTPSVIIDMDIDGTGVTVEKFQKRSEKEVSENGKTVTKVSLENSYKVNGVPMGLQKFKQKMATYGFDTEKFLQLSHIDVFTNQMASSKESEKMRETLFEMTDSYTDFQIAEMLGNIPDVAAMLEAYTKEEITSTQNDILRNIKKEYGNKGEILNAKIEGMEQSKVDIDVAEFELQRNSLKEQIAKNKAKQEDSTKQFEKYQKLSDGIMELQFAQSDMVRKANEENNWKRRELHDKMDDKKFLLRQTEDTIRDTERSISNTEETIQRKERIVEDLRNKYKTTQDCKFDESNLVCPFCKQEYSEDKKEQLRAEFESHKADEVKTITVQGNRAKGDLDTEKETMRTLELELEEHKKSKEMLNDAIAELEKQLSELPTSIDISDTEEYKVIQFKISEAKEMMKKMNNADEIRKSLKAELEDLQAQLTDIEKQIALSENNVKIDDQIADLRNKQSEYEQSKADAERILYQLSLVSKKKNELLTEEINSHFELVNFKLFDFQKNGEYKEVCVPQYKGKDLKVSTNTGLEMMMKLDIIKGLQKFYGQHFPVFVDGAECLSENTKAMINMDCQIVYLEVSESKELIVTNESRVE